MIYDGFSVCSIVRDEPKLIKGMIDACLPHIPNGSELVIIDGNCDSELDRMVYNYNMDDKLKYFQSTQPWEKYEWNNEALVRNMAAGLCKKDWILSLDADEAYAKSFYAKIPDLAMSGKKAFYLPTYNFFGSTTKIIDPEKWPDMHIRLFNKKYCRWVGAIHASVWQRDGIMFTPNSFDAKVLDEYLYHYARVKGDTKRPYGEVKTKSTIDFFNEHPRRAEFED